MININRLVTDLNTLRRNRPLVHNITNYVVMNNTANALLAIGASPVMAHSKHEVAEMASIASSLVLNIGTLDDDLINSMLIAGKTALTKQTPVVFDPVGAGATKYRTDTSKLIIEKCKPSIIRGNASEIIALCNNSKTKGVDSTDTSFSALQSVKLLATETKSIVVISGETDYITDGNSTEAVTNGSPLMERVTGMGCTATAIVAAFAAINPNMMEAASHAMAIMGIVGEISAKKSKGNGSMQVNILDELCTINEQTIKENIKI